MGKTMDKIWALERNYLVDYLTRVENATPEERQLAIDQFSTADTPDILSFDGNGRATISIVGPLSRSGPSFLDQLFGFGGTAYGAIIEAINAIQARDDIAETILRMDTPGGEVAGVENVAVAVEELAGKMKVTAVNHGMIASGGVWIAVAAPNIVANDPTVFTGSIGVIITAIDRSDALEKMGVRVVRIVSRNAPNKLPDIKTEAGIKVIQERADAIERQFIARVAKGRDTTEKDVIDNFGQGGMMIAFDPDKTKPSALSVGLIDQVLGTSSNSATTVNAPEASADGNNTSESPADAGNIQEEKPNMTFTEVMADPALKAAIDKKVSESHEAGVKEGRALMQARIDKAVPYIGNADYPGMEPLAAKVLKGESEIAALEGAVTAYDMLKGQAASTEAQTETEAQGETEGQAAEAPPEDEVAAAIKHDKAMLGEV